MVVRVLVMVNNCRNGNSEKFFVQRLMIVRSKEKVSCMVIRVLVMVNNCRKGNSCFYTVRYSNDFMLVVFQSKRWLLWLFLTVLQYIMVSIDNWWFWLVGVCYICDWLLIFIRNSHVEVVCRCVSILRCRRPGMMSSVS